MITVRRSDERRLIENKGQSTWLTFDWENKSDPLKNGFGVLKIFNEERLPPGCGFILHTHKDMVVVTYIHTGLVIYKGPLDDPEFLEANEFHQVSVTPQTKQYIFNPSQTEAAHLFQSGFNSPQAGLIPSGNKKQFTHAERMGILKLIASPNGQDSSLPIQQDVLIYSTSIQKGNHVIHEIQPGRNVWLHVVNGQILLNDLLLVMGDGVGLTDEISVSFTAQGPSEILLFDLCQQVPEVSNVDVNINSNNIEPDPSFFLDLKPILN
jgi:redox-sensitive bicupin YhaK (pirin superfamily)